MDVARLFNVHPWSCGSSLALLSFSTRTDFPIRHCAVIRACTHLTSEPRM